MMYMSFALVDVSARNPHFFFLEASAVQCFYFGVIAYLVQRREPFSHSLCVVWLYLYD